MIKVTHVKNSLGIDDVPRIYIGRPGHLGNPFIIGKDGDRKTVINKYESWLRGKLKDENWNHQREAFNSIIKLYVRHWEIWLDCWCAPEACHGDVLHRLILEEIAT